MKKITSKEVLYDYDYSADNLGIKVNHSFQYGETIEMEDGLLLDLDVNDVPTSLEILDASKRFNLPKDSLKNIVFLNVEICIDDKSIVINAVIGVLIDNVKNKQSIESFACNNYNIPNSVTQLALV